MARPTSGLPRGTATRLPTPAERAAELAEDERVTRREIRHAFISMLGDCLFSFTVSARLVDVSE